MGKVFNHERWRRKALVANWGSKEALHVRRVGYDRTLEIASLLLGFIKFNYTVNHHPTCIASCSFSNSGIGCTR